MSLPLAIQFLYHTPPGGSISANVVGMKLSGGDLGEVRRSIGLAGDLARVTINADPSTAIPEDWDIAQGEFLIQIGYDSNSVILGGYRCGLDERHTMGVRVSTDDPRPLLATLQLVTLPGMIRDGRSPLVRDTLRNIVLADGTPDATHPDYRTISELTDILLDAIGIAHDPAPLAMDTAIDGATALDPPGPLDWGNAVAIAELDGLLARYGWAAAMNLDGDTLRIFRLLRGGEPVVVPGAYDDLVEPYVLAPKRGVRAKQIVVTSGSTRSVIIEEMVGHITPEEGDPYDQFEWVAHDTRTGAWLNQDEWETAYPSEIAPGDIDAFREGESGDTTTDKDRARIFSALRIKDPALRRKVSGFVAVPAEIDIEAGEGEDAPLGGTVGYLVWHGCVRTSNQYKNWPAADGEGAAQPTRIEGCRFVPDAGVIILPPTLTWVRMPESGGGVGIAAEAEALDFADMRLVFAHEAREGDSAIDFYTSVWNVVNTAGVLSVARETDAGEIAAATSSRESAKMHRSELVRYLGFVDAAVDPVPLNDDALHEIAKQIALAKASDDLVLSGTIRIKGFHAIAPGDWEGAVSAVTWSLAPGQRGGATIVEVNTHETPASEYDRLARAANRSIGAGLGGYRLAASFTAYDDVRAAIAADLGDKDGSTGGGLATARTTARGRGRSAMGVAGAMAEPGAGGVMERGLDAHRVQEIWAVITGATLVSGGANKWEYDWEEVALEGVGYRKPTGRRTSTTTGIKARNAAEASNDGSGVEGNDIDVDALTGTWALQSVGRSGAIETLVLLRGPFGAGADARMIFNLRNAVDGECAA